MLHARLISVLILVFVSVHFLTACAHTVGPHCETRCGVQLVGVFPNWEMPERWSCDNLQLAEDVFLETFSDMYPNACKNVPSYLYFASTDEFMHAGESVAGLAVCSMAQVQLSALAPWESAYAHEMVHLMQKCDSPAPTDEGETHDHSDWVRSGIRARLSNWQNIMKEETNESNP